MTAPIKKLTAKCPAKTAPEGTKARWWREHVMKMSRQDISDLTGYSTTHIRNLEMHSNGERKGELPESSYRRYRLACAAISAGIEFDWVSTAVTSGGVKMTSNEDGTVFTVPNKT